MLWKYSTHLLSWESPPQLEKEARRQVCISTKTTASALMVSRVCSARQQTRIHTSSKWECQRIETCQPSAHHYIVLQQSQADSLRCCPHDLQVHRRHDMSGTHTEPRRRHHGSSPCSQISLSTDTWVETMPQPAVQANVPGKSIVEYAGSGRSSVDAAAKTSRITGVPATTVRY